MITCNVLNIQFFRNTENEGDPTALLQSSIPLERKGLTHLPPEYDSGFEGDSNSGGLGGSVHSDQGDTCTSIQGNNMPYIRLAFLLYGHFLYFF